MTIETNSKVKVDGYFVRYDCYKDDIYIVTRIVRFRSKEIAERAIKRWQNQNSCYNWSYRDIIEVNSSFWMIGPNKVNHLDFFNLKY